MIIAVMVEKEDSETERENVLNHTLQYDRNKFELNYTIATNWNPIALESRACPRGIASKINLKN